MLSLTAVCTQLTTWYNPSWNSDGPRLQSNSIHQYVSGQCCVFFISYFCIITQVNSRTAKLNLHRTGGSGGWKEDKIQCQQPSFEITYFLLVTLQKQHWLCSASLGTQCHLYESSYHDSLPLPLILFLFLLSTLLTIHHSLCMCQFKSSVRDLFALVSHHPLLGSFRQGSCTRPSPELLETHWGQFCSNTSSQSAVNKSSSTAWFQAWFP